MNVVANIVKRKRLRHDGDLGQVTVLNNTLKGSINGCGEAAQEIQDMAMLNVLSPTGVATEITRGASTPVDTDALKIMGEQTGIENVIGVFNTCSLSIEALHLERKAYSVEPIGRTTPAQLN